MLPKIPPREGQVGFMYVPPYRVQGVSVAGEETMIQVPELDVAFDIGMCPRVALPSPLIALSHAHMDHLGGLPYYFSQRTFQKIGVGKCACHARIAPALGAMMNSWIDLEQQRTPHEIIPMEPDQEIQIKNNLFLRAIEVSHTVPAMGYAVIERRSKLREEFVDLPQERLRELKSQGVQITKMLEIPLVAYTGDTEPGPFLFRDEFANAQIVISECTFFEPNHRGRARTGKHLHVEDLAALLNVWKAPTVIVVHVSRRTTLSFARERIEAIAGPANSARAHFIMDHRTNRLRYERQVAAAHAAEPSMSMDAEAPADSTST